MTGTDPSGQAVHAPQLRIEGPRATIRLARPEEHNRIDPADVPVLRAHLSVAVRHPDVRLLVITGSGSKTFSSGYTIDAILTQLDNGFEDLLDEVERCPLPTLAALNGSVYGGGCDLAMCCDFRIGVTGSRMMVPASRFGLHYYPGGLRRFVERLGPAAAKRVFLTSMPLPDTEMLRTGFLQELVAPEDLDARVDEWCAAFQAAEPGVVRSMKQQIDALASGCDVQRQGNEAFLASLRSPALRTRLASRRGD
jgi:enoyl-CoA hydratase/carnithine racemase